jgi:uncharacterized protein (TIGR02996 family)
VNQGDLLLRAILEDPGDILARLAYADWLLEDGQENRANWVRYSINVPQAGFSALVEDDPFLSSAWSRATRARVISAGCRASGGGANRYRTGPWSMTLKRGLDYGVENGFVRLVRATEEDFLKHAGWLFSRHPVTEVVLLGKEPFVESPGGGAAWSAGGEGRKYSLSPPIWEAYLDVAASMPSRRWHQNERDALYALSLACVLYGRRQAGALVRHLAHEGGGRAESS